MVITTDFAALRSKIICKTKSFEFDHQELHRMLQAEQILIIYIYRRPAFSPGLGRLVGWLVGNAAL